MMKLSTTRSLTVINIDFIDKTTPTSDHFIVEAPELVYMIDSKPFGRLLSRNILIKSSDELYLFFAFLGSILKV